MDIQHDFKELLALLNARHVEFLIVGGYALAFHGAPRYTGDIDLFIRPTQENAARVLAALNAFGFHFPNLSEKDFTNPDQVVQLGVPPVRIDLMTSISGVSWDEANASKVSGLYGDVPVYYIGLKEYIVNKKASGRQKDLADIEALDEP
ncbi:MAG: nucleotidyltransferase [Kiritimatiellia bacterium]